MADELDEEDEDLALLDQHKEFFEVIVSSFVHLWSFLRFFSRNIMRVMMTTSSLTARER